MSSFFVLSALLISASSAFCADYTVDTSHSSVGFKVRHLVSKVAGRFDKFEGKITYDGKHPEKMTFEGEISTDSINTDNAKRDGHLKNPDFFDAQKYPKITFKSTKVSPAGKGKYKVTGDYTMHGVTKPLTLNVEIGGEAVDPQGTKKLGLTATGKLNRKDYGIVWNKAMDQGGLMLGDEVELNIEVEANMVGTGKAK